MSYSLKNLFQFHHTHTHFGSLFAEIMIYTWHKHHNKSRFLKSFLFISWSSGIFKNNNIPNSSIARKQKLYTCSRDSSCNGDSSNNRDTCSSCNWKNVVHVIEIVHVTYLFHITEIVHVIEKGHVIEIVHITVSSHNRDSSYNSEFT